MIYGRQALAIFNAYSSLLKQYLRYIFIQGDPCNPDECVCLYCFVVVVFLLLFCWFFFVVFCFFFGGGGYLQHYYNRATIRYHSANEAEIYMTLFCTWYEKSVQQFSHNTTKRKSGNRYSSQFYSTISRALLVHKL